MALVRQTVNQREFDRLLLETELDTIQYKQNDSLDESLNEKLIDLYIVIDELNKYGEQLKSDGKKEGDLVLKMSSLLKSKVKEFMDGKYVGRTNEFKNDFLILLHRFDNEINNYRFSLKTVILNILIAATGLGAIFLGVQLLYTSYKQGRPLFFFQKPNTHRERLRNKIVDCLRTVDFKDIHSKELLGQTLQGKENRYAAKIKEINTFFSDVKEIANKMSYEGQHNFFTFNKIKKAALINEAVTSVESEFNGVQKPEAQETLFFHNINQILNYKVNNKPSIIEALNLNRLFVQRKVTRTLDDFERHLRNQGISAGFRKLKEFLIEKFSLLSSIGNDDFPNVRLDLEDEIIHVVINNQGIADVNYPNGSVNAEIVNRITNAKIAGLSAEICSGGVVFGSYIRIQIDYKKYDEVIRRLAELPALRIHNRMGYNK